MTTLDAKIFEFSNCAQLENRVLRAIDSISLQHDSLTERERNILMQLHECTYLEFVRIASLFCGSDVYKDSVLCGMERIEERLGIRPSV